MEIDQRHIISLAYIELLQTVAVIEPRKIYHIQLTDEERFFFENNITDTSEYDNILGLEHN